MKIYIAGPMRGYPKYNFAAFDAAEADLTARGYEVASPAQMDRDNGFDGTANDLSSFDVPAAIRRDIDAILSSDAVVLLAGWDRSTGAKAELAVASWAGKQIWLYPSLTPLANEDILEEALRITRGDRQAQYGPPDQDFKRTACMWSALKGVDFTAREVALFMVALKLSRQTHQDKRDNWVDIAGYARCGSICG